MELCQQRDATGATVQRNYFDTGEERLESGTSQSYYYTQDHLGSIREVVDATGTSVARYDYDVWGRRTQVEGTFTCERGFTGHWHHAWSNLIIAPLRAYDSDTGRWLSEDPIEEAGGLNLYGYVGNGPVMNTDPSGLWFFSMSTPTASMGTAILMAAMSAAPVLRAPQPDNVESDFRSHLGPFDAAGLAQVACSAVRLAPAIAESLSGFVRGLSNGAPKGGMTLADDMAILRQATTGKGNFGVGSASQADAMRLGQAWVGEGGRTSGDILISKDGLRQFRPPSFKPSSTQAPTGTQANFEWRNVNSGKWQGNGHLDITP